MLLLDYLALLNSNQNPITGTGDRPNHLCTESCNWCFCDELVSDQKRYVRVLAVLNFLKFYVLYALFELFGLLCVVSSLDVFIGDLKWLKAGIVVLLM
jgi:hypothetical protein